MSNPLDDLKAYTFKPPLNTTEVDVDVIWGNGKMTRHTFMKEQQCDDRASRQPENPTALIGFLAAKLACHNPQDGAVQWALKWLEGQGG